MYSWSINKNNLSIFFSTNPKNTVPGSLSLVSGVLDKKFNFWSLPVEKRNMFIEKLYNALIELLLRFEEDWSSNKVNKNNILIVNFDRMMNDFDGLMSDITSFVDFNPSQDFLNDIKETADKQRAFKSGHKYDLDKFGLTEEKIKNDCKKIYDTFLS